MADYKKIQSSLTSGEISPRLLARVDLAAYDTAVTTMLNAYPYTHGGATRRPGTMYIGEVYDSTQAVRLIPFVYSRTQSYLIVINGGYFQFVRDGAFLTSGGSPDTRISLACSYTESELPEITYAQYGNTLILAHPNHHPKQLQRISDSSWTLTDLSFTYKAIADYWYYSSYINFKLLTTGDGFVSGDKYTITTDGSGSILSGPTFTGTGTGSIAQVSITAALDPQVGSPIGQTWTIECDYSTADRQEFTVTGSVTGVPTVQWYEDNYPKAVSFYEQRLFFAGTGDQPQTLWASKNDDITDFTIGPNDNDGLNFTIASNRYDEIIQLETARHLLPLTYGGEFSMAGATGGITPTAVAIRAHTFHGTNNVKPVRIGQEVVFVQRDGKKLRAISYDVTLDSNVAPDLTILSEHITGDGIVDMSFAQDPDNIAWMVRSDGMLLTMTHVRSQDVTGWARHSTDGTFLNVCCVPEEDRDLPYVIVERTSPGSPATTVRNLEVITYDTYTDSHLTGTSLSPTATWTGLDHLEGYTVAVIADGYVHPNCVVSGGQITLDYAASSIEAGLPYTTTIELLHPEVSLSDGTSQGRALTIYEVVLRLQDTIGLRVNGDDVPVLNTVADLDTAPVPYTGDKKVSIRGWSSPNNLSIEQVLPRPFTLLGVVLKLEVND